MGINLDEIKLQDYYPFIKEKCSYTVKGEKLECLSGTNTTTKSISFPYPIGLVDSFFTADNAVSGDSVDCYVSYEITKEVDVNTSSNLFLPTTEWPGFIGSKIVIANDEYEIVGIDEDGWYLLDRNYDDNYNGLYQIESKCPIFTKLYLNQGYFYETHKKTFGCKLIPIGAEIIIKYNHKNTLTENKELYFNLGYLYGNIQE